MRFLSEQEAGVLTALQRGVPITEYPFKELGLAYGLAEAEVLDFIRQLRVDGRLRRFGAIFDARRLGYRSVLCAVRVPTEQLAEVAARVTPVSGVTHVYERGWPLELARDSVGGPRACCWPNLWFTLAAPASTYLEELDTIRTACRPYALHELPALKRFKIDVIFDLRTRERDESVAARSFVEASQSLILTLTPPQKLLVRLCGGDMPITARFFLALATQLGISEQALLEQLRDWHAQGIIRRIGPLLRHREIGFKANGMCCWDLPPEEVLAAGRRVAEFAEVTHCYERPWTEVFPFRLYAMIHTSAWSDTQRLFERITSATGLQGGQLMFSLTEFKKSSMQFF